MSESLLSLTVETTAEDALDSDSDSEYTYDCWQNESYDSDFLLSCVVTMVIFIYVQFADYIAKKYVH
jgi:hypothetical protein